MKPSPLNRLAENYLTALRRYSAQGSGAGLAAAHDLGAAAVAGGLETLALAKVHNCALAALLLESDGSLPPEHLTAHAREFFTEAVIPLEGTHRLAREASTGLQQLHTTLERRTSDLAESRLALQQQVAGRRKAEAALRTSERSSRKLLKDSRLLEKQLQEVIRKVLSATEAERKKMSHNLNDQIAQNLLAINLRMLALKKDVATNHADILQEIATTQQLVDESAAIIRRLAHEFRLQYER